jgi:hypothetical protein
VLFQQRLACRTLDQPTTAPIRGNNGNARCSFAFACVQVTPLKSRNHAVLPNGRERPRTSAANRQAGGHWFEPSTAHLNLRSYAETRMAPWVRCARNASNARIVHTPVHTRVTVGKTRDPRPVVVGPCSRLRTGSLRRHGQAASPLERVQRRSLVDSMSAAVCAGSCRSVSIRVWGARRLPEAGSREVSCRFVTMR